MLGSISVSVGLEVLDRLMVFNFDWVSNLDGGLGGPGLSVSLALHPHLLSRSRVALPPGSVPPHPY